MIFLRLYLLVGLLVHKLVWEVLKKRRARSAEMQPRSLWATVAKFAKLVILLGLLLQTITPEFLPILERPVVLRVIGLLIYSLGLATAVSARIELGNNWLDIEQARVMSQHNVVATGVYRMIRHPIYVGDLLLLAGLELALNSWLILGVVALAPLVLAMAIREEQMLIKSLPGYETYCRKTKRFIPLLI